MVDAFTVFFVVGSVLLGVFVVSLVFQAFGKDNFLAFMVGFFFSVEFDFSSAFSVIDFLAVVAIFFCCFLFLGVCNLDNFFNKVLDKVSVTAFEDNSFFFVVAGFYLVHMVFFFKVLDFGRSFSVVFFFKNFVFVDFDLASFFAAILSVFILDVVHFR